MRVHRGGEKNWKDHQPAAIPRGQMALNAIERRDGEERHHRIAAGFLCIPKLHERETHRPGNRRDGRWIGKHSPGDPNRQKQRHDAENGGQRTQRGF